MSAGDGALKGATRGAAIGSYWGPWGTVIGAGAGAIGGALFRGDEGGADVNQAKMAEIRQRLEDLARKQRAQREEDLQRAMAYFAPAQAELKRLYGFNMPLNATPVGGGK